MESKRLGDAIVVRLERGEEVLTRLTELCRTEEIRAASLQGIGALKDVELGFYELETRTYHRRTLPEDYELLSMLGNVTRLADDAPFVHAHVTLGDMDYKVHGGHMFSGVVAVTVEVVLRPLAGSIARLPNEDVGLNLWCLADQA